MSDLKEAASVHFWSDRLKEVPGNSYRLNRVLEIVLATRRPLAELDLDTEAPLDYDFRCFFLNRPRVELYRRIDARCEEMVVSGLLQVVFPPALSMHCCCWNIAPQKFLPNMCVLIASVLGLRIVDTVMPIFENEVHGFRRTFWGRVISQSSQV